MVVTAFRVAPGAPLAVSRAGAGRTTRLRKSPQRVGDLRKVTTMIVPPREIRARLPGARRTWRRKVHAAAPAGGQLSGSSAISAPVGFVDPEPGSTVNASLVEPPRFDSTAVVDGATAAASMVPADVAPASLTSHIW